MRTRPISARSVTGDAVENEARFLPRGLSLTRQLRGKDELTIRVLPSITLLFLVTALSVCVSCASSVSEALLHQEAN